MHEQKLRELAGILERIAGNAVNPSEFGGSEQGLIIIQGGVGFALLQNETDAYYEVIDNLLNDEGWGDKFSESLLDKRLQQVLSDLIEGRDDANAAELLRALDVQYTTFDTRQTVYTPISGVQLDRLSPKLGNVVLVNATRELCDQIIASMRSVIDKIRNTPDGRENALHCCERDVLEKMQGEVFSVYQVISEPVRALERAELETRRAVDILRVTIPALYARSQRVLVGLPGEAGRRTQWTLVLSDRGITVNRRAVGSVIPLHINEKWLAYLDEVELTAASEMLQRPESSLNDYERAILRGVHWFAAAQTQDELGNRFLALVTSVESLLTPRDGNPIGTAIAEGVALLLGDNLESRKRLKRRMKQLYGQRSAVSHGGRKSILESDYIDLEWISGQLLVTLIQRRTEFNSQRALLEWIEEKKLT